MDRETTDTTTTVVLVLDGDTDAGYRVARKLLADGCRVAVAGRHPDGVVRVMHGYSADRVLAIAADVTDLRQWSRVAEAVRKRFGRLDTVIRAEGSGASEATGGITRASEATGGITRASEATGGITALRAVGSETAVRSHDRRAQRSPRSLGAEVWAQSSSAS
jgi:NAD(P)-dependent dehydrogenase (short-subunit alcohol dehydrogenase family)